MFGISFLSFNIPVLLISFALAFLYPYLLYRKESKLSKKLQLFLSITRGFFTFIISLFLLSPLFNHNSLSYEKPIIVFAQDNSKSIILNKYSEYYKNEYLKERGKFIDELSSKYDVKEIVFDEQIRSELNIDYKGLKSNFSVVFDELKDNYKNRNLAAIVFATDGINNIGKELDEYYNQVNIPIYSLLMGDSIQKKDVRIADVIHNEIVYFKNDFLVDIRINAYQLANRNAEISIIHNGKKVFSNIEKISTNNQKLSLKATLNANEPGFQKYTVQIKPIAGEENIANNTLNFYIEVIENKQNIGIIAASVHPDLAAIKNAIESNENYKVDIQIASEVKLNELKKYQLLILHQLPSSFNTGNDIFQYLKQNNLPYWLIIGNQTYIDLLNKLNLGVRITSSKNSPNESFAIVNKDFTGFVLNEKWQKLSNELPPLQSPYGNYQNDNSSTTLFKQRIGNINTEQPLLVFSNMEVKRAILFGEGIWKWRLLENKINGNSELVDELCSKIIQYLSVKDDKRKFKVYLENQNPEESDDIIFIAELYNDSYEAINSPDVNIEIKNSSNKSFPYTFNKSSNRYELNIKNLPEGTYTYEAKTELGQNKYSAKGKFNIIKLNLEELNTVAEFDKLRNLSELNGAKAFKANELSKLKTELLNNSNFKTISYEENKTEEWINFKWIFVLLLLLISMEWFIRKYEGLY